MDSLGECVNRNGKQQFVVMLMEFDRLCLGFETIVHIFVALKDFSVLVLNA